METPSEAGKPIRTLDSWVNPTTGVGGANDKAAGFLFVPGTDRLWSGHLLGEIYEVDDICARIVDALPSAAFERGWSLDHNLEAEQAEAVRDALDYFKVQEHLQSTRRWARLYGGAALYIGSDDGPQDTPLQYGGRMHFLQPYEREELQPHRYYDDPLSAKFGECSHYRLTPMRSTATGPSVVIHESRLVVMHGTKSTNRKRAQNNGWGSSVLIRPIKPIQQFQAAYAIVLSMLGDANQNVYKWKGLADLLLAGREEVIEARMRLMDRVRSTVHGIAVDADEEDFVRSQINMSGVDAILDKFAIRIAAAAIMPVTVLLGQSPAGMNATGESDLRNWGSQVSTEKRDVFKPALEYVIRVMFRASNGPTGGVEPTTWTVQFPSQWEPTPREEAEIDNLNAQTDQLYVDMQVLTPAAVAKARFSGDTEQQKPLVTEEQLAALEAAQTPPDTATETPEAIAAALNPTDEVDTEDDATVATEPAIDETVTQLAARMTEHGIERCFHLKSNRCPICQIERVRDFTLGPNGEAIWRILWRPIGTTGFGIPETADPDPDTDA